MLGEADVRLSAGQSVGQVCRALEIAESTYHRWRNQYGGMKNEEAKRRRTLEKENAQLKRMIDNLMLDNEMLRELARENI